MHTQNRRGQETAMTWLSPYTMLPCLILGPSIGSSNPTWSGKEKRGKRRKKEVQTSEEKAFVGITVNNFKQLKVYIHSIITVKP